MTPGAREVSCTTLRSTQRKIIDKTPIDDLARFGVLGLDGQCAGRYLYRLLRARNLHREVHGDILVDIELETFLYRLAEAR